MASNSKEEVDTTTFLATTLGKQEQEEILDNETSEKTRPRKKKTPSTQESIQTLQASVDELRRQVAFLSMQPRKEPNMENTLLENKLIKRAKQRLRFDIKDVHGCIQTWDHFFQLYGIDNDFEKFFAVEQLLPGHIQRAMSSVENVESSYRWLVSYLRNKYDPKYLCFEMSYRTITKSTNINEIEDLATEAANCPKEHVIKHFMLEACSYNQRQKMKPYLLLPMKEFKFKLKMIVYEENGRFTGNQGDSNHRKVRVIDEEDGAAEISEGKTDQLTASTTREFKRSSTSGNAKA